jgi:hypothetical protein
MLWCCVLLICGAYHLSIYHHVSSFMSACSLQYKYCTVWPTHGTVPVGTINYSSVLGHTVL